MSEHTPGPWHIHNGSPTTVVGPTGGWIAQLWKWATGKKMAEANARLIAEAPALLVELKANTEVLTKILPAIDADELPSLHAIVRASVASSTDAIAKAEGQG